MPENPEYLRLQAQQIARDKIDAARRRARSKLTRMTPNKARAIAREQTVQARERARQRLVWSAKVNNAPQGSPNWDKPSQVGPWNEYYAERIPESKARFTPRRGLVDDYVNEATEGLQTELVEKYGVPAEYAGDVASDAIDQWARIVKAPSPQDAPSPTIPMTMIPRFKVHNFSPVEYSSGDSMAQSFSGYDDGGKAYAGNVAVTHEVKTGSGAGEELPPIALPDSNALHLPVDALKKLQSRNYGKSVVPLAIVAGLLVYAVFKKPGR